MEYVLHRVNTLERLRAGIEAGCDRLEVDVRSRRGELLVTHDPPIGPWAVGVNGVQFSRWAVPAPHWQGRFLRLGELLEEASLPLLLDLKGTWTDAAFGHLVRFLAERGRHGDLLASDRWSLFERCRRSAAPLAFVYGLPSHAVSLFLDRLGSGLAPYAVSMRPRLARSDELRDRLQRTDIRFYVWAVRVRRELEEFERAGAAGVIFDDASWLRGGPSRDGGI
ncbi:MAG: glycerophosphodiester phosphodiesterase [Actinomycetota bacterium]